MNEEMELLRNWRAGDKCRVLGMTATIILVEGKHGSYLYHLRAEEDESELELPHRVFKECELERL